MKIMSWNVNGMRSILKKGFETFLIEEQPDILCLQETKVLESQLTNEEKKILGYESYWASAVKKGYSGVSIYTKIKCKEYTSGIDIPQFDEEGRVNQMEFKDFIVINAYFPNSKRDHTRLPYKLEFCSHLLTYCNKLIKEGQNIILCGDFNIAHEPIDLTNPKSNENNAGYLPEERDWMKKYLMEGYVDTFRKRHSMGGHYTWWSYRPGVRERNIGWRLDYFCVNESLDKSIKSALIHPQVMGSDHCPISLML